MTEPTTPTSHRSRRMPEELSSPATRENVDNFFRKMLIVIPIVVVLAVIAFGIFWMSQGISTTAPAAPSAAEVPSNWWAWTTVQYASIPVWSFIAGVVSLVVVLYFLVEIRIKFITIVLAALFVILVLELFKYGMLDEGMRRPALYVVAIALLLALVQLKENRLALLFSLVVFGTLGISHLTDYQGLKSYAASSWPSSAVVLNGGICTEKVQRATLSNRAQELNPNGGCYMRWAEEVRGQCVDVYDRWDRYLGNNCTGSINLDQKYGAKFAASTRGNTQKVSIAYVLCNKRGQTNIATDGCP